MSDGMKGCRTRPRGVENVRTMKSQGARSLPRSHSDAYIDLFVLHKEKERLEKELSEMAKRAEKTTKRLEELGVRIEKLQTSNGEEKEMAKEPLEGVTAKKDWKVVNINY